MGVTRKDAEPPNSASTEREWARFYFLRTFVHFLKLHKITNTELTEILDLKYPHVVSWFVRGDKVRIPTFPMLRKIYETFQKSDYTPSGAHGRKFNYVELFEDAPYTQHEMDLIQKVRALEARIRELENRDS